MGSFTGSLLLSFKVWFESRGALPTENGFGFEFEKIDEVGTFSLDDVVSWGLIFVSSGDEPWP